MIYTNRITWGPFSHLSKKGRITSNQHYSRSSFSQVKDVAVRTFILQECIGIDNQTWIIQERLKVPSGASFEQKRQMLHVLPAGGFCTQFYLLKHVLSHTTHQGSYRMNTKQAHLESTTCIWWTQNDIKRSERPTNRQHAFSPQLDYVLGDRKSVV